MRQINVLVVDDSAFMRKLISDFLAENPLIKVIGTARNGKDGLKKVKELNPDVVTMDVEMPLLNGLDAVKKIMEEHPVPVIMLSSTTKAGAENTVIAIENGAFDFIAKPSGAISLDLHKIKEELVRKVILASKISRKQLINLASNRNFSSIHEERYSKIEPSESSKIIKISEDHYTRKVICIGTSTGGPRALQKVLTKLPSNMDAGILIVQHMPAGFTKSLADRLDSLCDISVKEAIDGEIVKKGTAYIAPGGLHLKVKQSGADLIIQLDKSEPKNGHRPAVDVLFESVSEIKEYKKIAVIMTGMGSDGTKGLITMKETGTVTAIAESQETSIVFGMPKAAISTRLVDEIQDVEKIADCIMKHV
ncbi:chemotaxis response regulator protein-glutamate methylesterase [Bacillus sp. S/N-304-OC-R1]|uniref:protein-glutamate methylesterase/protein-glutamine glutaminase n=1 Tax=Bacillus sp. S/N-304-OC-R1 TaxID=2758034 RepID=UPI001C8E1FBF|nr:chemotaxis response regulator protein-glutamate methylesterase [Bacillus sp. S/N-304-OC-R1]MBY0120675.1 chemotaxis response regulator protein-glutamate methylesterase [Bacillus sp. S/N-304-OC-R1]